MESEPAESVILKTTPKRSNNFNHSEESLLIYLAKKYKHILENKKSDTNANRQKTSCWATIADEFNSQSGNVHRNALVLKKKYENMKKRTKTRIAEEKCYRYKTGGGPFKEFKFTDVDETVIELLGHTRLEGLPSEFGGDAVQENALKQTETSEENGIILNIEHENQKFVELTTELDGSSFSNYENIILQYDDEEKETGVSDMMETSTESGPNKEISVEKPTWAKYTPALLKTPKAKALTAGNNTQNKGQNISNKLSQWAGVKVSMEEQKNKLLEEEHKAKIALLKEKYNVEMDILKAESQARILKIEEEKNVIIQSLKEEHKIKMQILELQKCKMLQELQSKKN